MTDYDQLERRAAEVEGILVHLHRDELLRLVAIARAAEKAERVLQQAAVDASCQGVLMEWAGLMEERAAALREALSPEKERTE